MDADAILPKCSVCGRGLRECGSLTRNGPVGTMDFRCFVHVDPQWRPSDQEQDLTDLIIERASNNGTR